MTVGEMQRRMTSRELAEWQQLDLIRADKDLGDRLAREAEAALVAQKAKRKRGRG